MNNKLKKLKRELESLEMSKTALKLMLLDSTAMNQLYIDTPHGNVSIKVPNNTSFVMEQIVFKENEIKIINKKIESLK